MLVFFLARIVYGGYNVCTLSMADRRDLMRDRQSPSFEPCGPKPAMFHSIFSVSSRHCMSTILTVSSDLRCWKRLAQRFELVCPLFVDIGRILIRHRLWFSKMMKKMLARLAGKVDTEEKTPSETTALVNGERGGSSTLALPADPPSPIKNRSDIPA
jgi:hypothetical protein